MKEVKATITCIASYEAIVDVPDEITSLDDAAKYINEKINDIPCGELTFVCDGDNEVTAEDCQFITTNHKVLSREHKECACCMEEHDVLTVEIDEDATFKGFPIKFKAVYQYCENANEYAETPDMMVKNLESMKIALNAKYGTDAYKKGQ